MDGFGEIMQAINSGGNAAMIVCIWFIWKSTEGQKEIAAAYREAAERLARIEKALSKFLEDSQR